MQNATTIGIGLDAPVGTYRGHGETRKDDILKLMIVTMFIVVPILVLRMYTRIRVVRFFGWDDWLILASGIGVVAFAIYSTYTVISHTYGNGEHVEYVSHRQVMFFFLSFWLYEIGYTIAHTLVKCSILAYYLRLQPTKIVICTLIFVALSGLSIALAFMFQCNPVDNAWDVELTGGSTCIDTKAVVYSSASFSIATDFWVWGLAINMFKGLKVPTRQKIGVIAIFSVGIIACVSSIVRLYTVKEYYDSNDPTWDSFPIVIWSFLEVGLGILAACIPTVKPLVQKVVSGFEGGSSRVKRTRTSSWRMNGVEPSTDVSQSSTLRPKSSSANSTRKSRFSAFFSRGDSTAVNTQNTTATTVGLSEVREWGLDENDFCTDPGRRHTLPDTEAEQEKKRRSRKSELVGDNDDFDLEAQISKRGTEGEEVRAQENVRRPSRTPDSGEKDEIHESGSVV